MKLAYVAVVIAIAVPAAAEQPAPTAPAASTAAAPKPLNNTIKWSTASEVDNFGYDVFRGDKEEGPFTRLNPKIIAGAATIDEPRYYSYVDESIEVGKEYWYYVESVSLAGVREKFTPVFKSKPKAADGSVIGAATPPARPTPPPSR